MAMRTISKCKFQNANFKFGKWCCAATFSFNYQFAICNPIAGVCAVVSNLSTSHRGCGTRRSFLPLSSAAAPWRSVSWRLEPVLRRPLRRQPVPMLRRPLPRGGCLGLDLGMRRRQDFGSALLARWLRHCRGIGSRCRTATRLRFCGGNDLGSAHFALGCCCRGSRGSRFLERYGAFTAGAFAAAPVRHRPPWPLRPQ